MAARGLLGYRHEERKSADYQAQQTLCHRYARAPAPPAAAAVDETEESALATELPRYRSTTGAIRQAAILCPSRMYCTKTMSLPEAVRIW